MEEGQDTPAPQALEVHGTQGVTHGVHGTQGVTHGVQGSIHGCHGIAGIHGRQAQCCTV